MKNKKFKCSNCGELVEEDDVKEVNLMYDALNNPELDVHTMCPKCFEIDTFIPQRKIISHE